MNLISVIATAWFLSSPECGAVKLPDGLSHVREAREDKGDLVVTHRFRNDSDHEIDLGEVRIFQPWNDNYPDAETCLTNRVHAHLFALGPHAWVEAVRMDGEEVRGFMLTRGELGGYAVEGRGRRQGSSNTRGILSLIPKERRLRPGEITELEGRYFPCAARGDFKRELLARGGTFLSADRYAGEVASSVTLRRETSSGVCEEKIALSLGSQTTADGIELLGLPPIEELLGARARFILDHQRVTDRESVLYGAFLPYDNETERIYLNREEPIDRPDCNEGRERIGMGVFLCRYALRYGDATGEIARALKDYAAFLRTRLQDDDYVVYSSVSRHEPPRVYNYPWIATFYAELAKLTGETRYHEDALQTMRAAYREEGGGSFYMIGAPVLELPELKELFRQTADTFLANGAKVPKFEVNYEQSIVAPAVDFLLQFYLLTREDKYLKGAKEMMRALEAFNGRQPSWHLNDIAIRHWDGYWFGKRQIWGDTMPHYWSAITAAAFLHYAEATGDELYRDRARAIFLQNLGSFTPDGRASCAWIYPNEVNGVPVKGLDPLANDQDWALAFLLYSK
ncbi:MAG: six-hairpin glycosidase, partial [Kiritimatiellae bacterium]|nr:six-hairpin glycosidase [Kiritimatiellia bacterium]